MRRFVKDVNTPRFEPIYHKALTPHHFTSEMTKMPMPPCLPPICGGSRGRHRAEKTKMPLGRKGLGIWASVWASVWALTLGF